MNDDPNTRRIMAHIGRPEGGERITTADELASKRATDLYEQSHPGAPFIFAGRRPGETPVEVTQAVAETWQAGARIVRNLLHCDLWRLEPAPPDGTDAPYRLATVWRAPNESGEIETPLEILEVER